MTKTVSALSLVVLALTACQSAPPMPSDLRVVAPSAQVSSEARQLAGTWVGKWNDEFDHVLVVEDINDTTAIVVYSVGAFAKEGIQPSYRRVRATVSGATLRFKLGQSAVDYDLRSDGALVGTFEAPTGRISRAYMKRGAAKQ